MAIRKLFSLVSLVVFAFACSKQSEGERCMLTNGPTGDCDDGLTCQGPIAANGCNTDSKDSYNCLPDRCCPAFGTPPSDSRCIGYSVPGGTITTGTGGADAGATETGGSSSAGATAGGSSNADAGTGGASSSGGSSDTGGTSASST